MKGRNMLLLGALLTVISVFGGVSLMLSAVDQMRPKGIANRITKCWDDTNWETQTFMYEGTAYRTHDGETRFYSKRAIDKGIKCTNDLIEELRASEQ